MCDFLHRLRAWRPPGWGSEASALSGRTQASSGPCLGTTVLKCGEQLFRAVLRAHAARSGDDDQ
eukprot:3812242-Prorocentrum_lima.AAC.1